MKITTPAVLGLLAALMLAGCATPERQTTAWEYKVVTGPNGSRELQQEINKAADEGWEFVSMAGTEHQVLFATMKRPKR